MEAPASILLLPEDIDALQSQAAKDLHDDLRRGWHAKAVIAGVQQQRIAAAFAQAGPLHNEALGQLIGVVEPWIYEEMRRRHGEDCWRDQEFRRRFFRENPEAGIRSRSRKTMVRVDGRKGSHRDSAGARTGTGARLWP